MSLALDFDLVIKGGVVVTAADEVSCNIAVKDGKVVLLMANLPVPDGYKVVDAEGSFVTRNLSLPDLFVTRRSVYWYTGGYNLRALVAFALGVVPCLPGFIRNVNAKIGIPVQATYVYVAVCPVGLLVAGGIYLLLSCVFPPAPLPTTYSAGDYAHSLGSGSVGADEKEKDLAAGGTVVAV